MTPSGVLLVALALLASPAAAQREHPTPPSVTSRLPSPATARSVYVRHLRTGASVAIQADDTFPTASMVKVPIMIGVFDAIHAGKFAFTDTAPEPRAVAKYPEDDILAGLSDTARITVSRLLTLSLTYSDNSASLWLQQLAGAGTTINGWLERNSFVVTRVNARTPGREADYQTWGWGQTTPREMARLVTLIRQGKVVSPARARRCTAR
jgi:beta-lactamase class A